MQSIHISGLAILTLGTMVTACGSNSGGPGGPQQQVLNAVVANSLMTASGSSGSNTSFMRRTQTKLAATSNTQTKTAENANIVYSGDISCQAGGNGTLAINGGTSINVNAAAQSATIAINFTADETLSACGELGSTTDSNTYIVTTGANAPLVMNFAGNGSLSVNQTTGNASETVTVSASVSTSNLTIVSADQNINVSGSVDLTYSFSESATSSLTGSTPTPTVTGSYSGMAFGEHVSGTLDPNLFTGF